MALHEHFNNLNPAQHEALVKLAEEATEVAQACMKALLHGLDSTEPGTGTTNKERIQNELGDLLFFMNVAADQGVVHSKEVQKAGERRAKRLNHYLHHIDLD